MAAQSAEMTRFLRISEKISELRGLCDAAGISSRVYLRKRVVPRPEQLLLPIGDTWSEVGFGRQIRLPLRPKVVNMRDPAKRPDRTEALLRHRKYEESREDDF